MKKHFILILVVFSAFNVAYAFEKNYTATKKSVTTNKGAMIDTGFQLKISGLQEAEVVTTEDSVELSVVVTPAPSDVGKRADIYNAVLIGDQWWMLNLEGQYVPWNRYVKQLVPFTEEVLLEESTTVNFLSGKFAASGNVRYFFGYMTTEDPFLVYTGKAFSINISDGSVMSFDEQLSTFKKDFEDTVVQNKCVICHVDGGLAKGSGLNFSRSSSLSAENNLETLKKYISTHENGSTRVLEYASGKNAHPGGEQLIDTSDLYKNFEAYLIEISGSASSDKNIEFSEGGDTQDLQFFGNVVLETRLQTLRRAARLLANRFPTDSEIKEVTNDGEAGLRNVVRNMMTGHEFRKFAVNAANDRLFTMGPGEPANNVVSTFPKLTNKRYSVIKESGNDYWFRNYFSVLTDSLKRSSGELVAYIVENERDYTEVVTADYTMVNPMIDQLFGSTAEFSEGESLNAFKPGKINGFYLYDALDVGDWEYVDNQRVQQTIITGDPVTPFPHSGILSDFAFLGRYPTTATNRNRARARWTYYHFLDIDVEGSAPRPTDPDALADTNNPTMNNPACTACHATLDTVAAAFQNWDEYQQYSPNGGALDSFYKYPEDGSTSLYTYGDTWYADMRAASLFGSNITDNLYTLKELGEKIAQEDGFYTASVKFWWQSIFGEKPIAPYESSDSETQAQIQIAYQNQKTFISELAEILKQSKNMKDILTEMIMSEWFRASSATSLDFKKAYEIAAIGSSQLLNPSQLSKKTQDLTGLVWGRSASPSNYINVGESEYWDSWSSMNLLYGGIDSGNVLERQENLTPLMINVPLSQATDLNISSVALDFTRDKGNRKLFNLVEPSTSPVSSSQTILEVQKDNQREIIEMDLPNTASSISLSLSAMQNTCLGWTQENGCADTRSWRLYDFSYLSSSGQWISKTVSEDNFSVTGGEYCQFSGDSDNSFKSFNQHCSLTLKESIEVIGNILKIRLDISAIQAKTESELTKVRISLNDEQDPYLSTTQDAQLIKSQIRELYLKFLGHRKLDIDGEVEDLYSLFISTWLLAKESKVSDLKESVGNNGYLQFSWFSDSQSIRELTDNFDQYVNENGWLSDTQDLSNILREDSFYTKRAWSAVILYLMAHPYYLYE